jgi:hypothetical protein
MSHIRTLGAILLWKARLKNILKMRYKNKYAAAAITQVCNQKTA